MITPRPQSFHRCGRNMRIGFLCAHVEDRVGKCGNRRPYHLGGRRHCGNAVEGNGGNTAKRIQPDEPQNDIDAMLA